MDQVAYAFNHPAPTMQDVCGEILGRANISTVLAQLHHLPERCAELERRVATLREEIANFKGNILAQAKESCETATLMALMEAPQTTTDGNGRKRLAAELEAERNLYIARSEGVQQAKAMLRAYENELASKESELALAETDLRKAQMQFKAATAECALLEAMVRSYSA